MAISKSSNKTTALKVVSIAVIVAILACVDPTGGVIPPNNPIIPGPLSDLDSKFQAFMTQLNLTPRDVIPVLWIYSPQSPLDTLQSPLVISGFGPNRKDRPWPNDPNGYPIVTIYEVVPDGCGNPLKKVRSLDDKARVNDERKWETTIALDPFFSGLIAATVKVGNHESDLSSAVVVRPSALIVSINKPDSTVVLGRNVTIEGSGPPGYCVMLIRDGQLSKFDYSPVAQDGRWSIANVPSDLGSHQYQVRLVGAGKDSEPVLFPSPIQLSWPLGGSNGEIIVQNWVGPNSGYPFGTCHYGIDFIAKENTEILAAADGTIVAAGLDSNTEKTPKKGAGFYVIVNHSGWASMYMHMISNPKEGNPPIVQIGQDVKAGTKIGLVGSTGLSTDPHLHLEIHLWPKGSSGIGSYSEFWQGRKVNINPDFASYGTEFKMRGIDLGDYWGEGKFWDIQWPTINAQIVPKAKCP